jgi:beta-lactam-binding protein with PASTA domain
MGRETHEADTIVQGEGLRMKIVMGDFTKYPENTVYKQSPPPGSRIPRGGTVSATISRGVKGASVEYPTDGSTSNKDNPEIDPDATPDKPSSPSGDPADN